MTGPSSSSTTTTTTTETFAIGWFEACAEHRGPEADAPCAECGWLVADHTADLAEVITVPSPTAATPLRRAS